jgi:hypothetical protein
MIQAASSHGDDLIPTAALDQRLGGSSRLRQRLVAAGWLKPVISSGPGGRNLFSAADVATAIERLKGGERPPLLPSELASRARRSPAVSTPNRLNVAHSAGARR